MTDLPHTRYQVGSYVYEPAANELRGMRRRIHLRPQTAALLNVLIDADGDVVSRQQIRDALWPPNTVLEFDLAIAACVKQLRQAFKDDASAPGYVETIHKRGYRLIAELSPASEAAPAPTDSAETKSRHWPVRFWFGAALAIIAALAWWLSTRVQDPERVLLFVAPMEQHDGQAAMNRASGLFDERLIDVLSAYVPRRIGVISRTTSQAADVRRLTAGQIGERFDADFFGRRVDTAIWQ